MPDGIARQETVIRPMCERDTPAIHEIHCECLQTSLASDYSREQLDAWMAGRSPDGYWRSFQSGSPFLVASIKGEIAGYANWVDDELMSLFVRPGCQNAGIGTKLFSACDEQACILQVKATPSAVDFYRRFGFQVVAHSFDVKRDVRLPHVFMQRAKEKHPA